MSFGPDPWQQQSWDWRAATNFMCGGAGGGLIVFAALAGGPAWLLAAGAALIGLGLSAVWLEIGRPLRALNVFLNPRTSWMSREAIVAALLMAAVASAWFDLAPTAGVAALLALGFVYCQARMLQAATGIPAWREPRLIPLVLATGIAEGAGLFLLLSAPLAPAPLPLPLWGALVAGLLLRLALWQAWRQRIRVAPRAAAAIDATGQTLRGATWLALLVSAFAVIVVVTAAASLTVTTGLDGVAAIAARSAQAIAGALCVASGMWFKYTLVTRGAYNQGFALVRLPVRGVPRG